ncbi:AMSH-like protease-like [Scleropages formosus]|uniref:AMSH-like protease-like n=1 Tax=Scleropages formosus TaxID=113540 RepID=A0A0P7X9T4_SCLFO|nr:AMSH-like protease-like [Scleropages formosus]
MKVRLRRVTSTAAAFLTFTFWVFFGSLKMDALGRSDPPALQPRDSMDQSFSFSSLKKLAAEPDHTDVSLSAVERVRALTKMGCSVEINEDIAPRRYFRSGVEMERMAAVYLEEGSLENAFVLYNKFITLFVEKLPSHRDYQQFSVPEKQVIMKKLQDVAFPRKDQLKKLLHEKYNKEHMEYLKSQSQAAESCNEQLQRLSLLQEERERVPEQTDGSCLARPPKNHVALDPNSNKPPAPANKPALTLGAVQNQRVDGLRRVVIPRDLTYKFLLLADGNTARGIETCGVLCGKLTHNEFVLTHVIVPKQSAGPDYCDMENVEELFSFQDQHDLLTLGWIHVSAFLSLPSPRPFAARGEVLITGVFRLTSSGMGEVGNCRMKGFHPHSKDPPLFSICKHIVVKDMKTTVLDLR